MDNITTALPRDSTPFSHHGGPTGALLAHGFSGTPGELRPLAERLAKQGYSVEAPLLAGHGGSQDELAAVTWRDWVSSARQALDTLRARCATVVLVGFSMGGAITLYLVLQRRLCKTAVFSGKSRPMSRLCWPSAPVIAAIRVSRSSTKAALRSYWKNPSL